MANLDDFNPLWAALLGPHADAVFVVEGQNRNGWTGDEKAVRALAVDCGLPAYVRWWTLSEKTNRWKITVKYLVS